jgi:hypothetical protein
MVNMFIFRKTSSKMPFHNNSMFRDAFSIHCYPFIGIRWHRTFAFFESPFIGLFEKLVLTFSAAKSFFFFSANKTVSFFRTLGAIKKNSFSFLRTFFSCVFPRTGSRAKHRRFIPVSFERLVTPVTNMHMS